MGPILFATDFGESAEHTLSRARTLAKLFEAPVLLVHVQSSHWKHWVASGAPEREAQQRLDSWKERLAEQHVEAKTEVARGNAAEAILGLAEAHRARLIVIGAGDKSLLSRYTTGSTAEAVARHAPIPVWISRSAADAPIRKILCGVDGSDSSVSALREASRLARLTGAELAAVGVIAGSPESPFGLTPEQVEAANQKHEDTQRAELEAFIDAIELDPAPRSRRYLRGRPSEVLQTVIEDDRFDLLVLGRTGATGLRRVFLGGTAERMLRKAACSLLLCGEHAAEG